MGGQHYPGSIGSPALFFCIEISHGIGPGSIDVGSNLFPDEIADFILLPRRAKGFGKLF